ncbi:MAG: methylenetetrahydrofolate reductase [NAD(P)H] [Candidatus Omnitrophica bacterium]|nr:methylenetetrahydrofolate reductase [NAD(P)H] [Candidatus Omnitrophota bacterium]
MKIVDILKTRESGVAFEFFPPSTQKSEERLIETVRILKDYQPLYVSMTHGAGGTDQTKTQKAVDILLSEGGLAVMPHLTGISASKSQAEELLKAYQLKGLENIMALRGDPPKEEIGAKVGDFRYAIDLVKFIKERSDLCIGVAVYPEGHIETESVEQDLDYTKQKIDSGADFAVTQMFFDNSYYYSFLDRMKKRAINAPVLPGILPLTNIAKVKEFASICRTTIPRQIEEKMEQFKDKPKEMEKVGIDFTIKQCRDLKSQGVKYIHFFTLNRPKVMSAILESI